MTPQSALQLLTQLVVDYSKTFADRPATQGAILASAQTAHDVVLQSLAQAAPPQAPSHGNDPA